jgi:hypothetical protein
MMMLSQEESQEGVLSRLFGGVAVTVPVFVATGLAPPPQPAASRAATPTTTLLTRMMLKTLRLYNVSYGSIHS